MVKLRTNQKVQHMSKKEVSSTNRQAKRKGKIDKIDTRDVRAINQDLRTIITYHNTYFKETKQTAQFNSWLSKQLEVELEVVSLKDKINHYFNTLIRAIGGRL